MKGRVDDIRGQLQDIEVSGLNDGLRGYRPAKFRGIQSEVYGQAYKQGKKLRKKMLKKLLMFLDSRG